MRNRRSVSNLTVETKVSVKSIFQICENSFVTNLVLSLSSVSSTCILILNIHLLMTILTFLKDTTTFHVSLAIRAVSFALTASNQSASQIES